MNVRRSVLLSGLLLGLALLVVLVLFMMGRAREPEASAVSEAAPIAPAPAAALPAGEPAAPAELVSARPVPAAAPTATAPAPPAPAAAPVPPQSFRLLVVDADSVPAPGATVQTLRRGAESHPERREISQRAMDVVDQTSTDAGGHASVMLEDDGLLVAFKPGVGSSGLLGTGDLPTDERGDSIVRLKPQITIAGIVVDAGGAPVAGVIVLIKTSGADFGTSHPPRPGPEMLTGADGRFAATVDCTQEFILAAFAPDGRQASVVRDPKPGQSFDLTVRLPGEWTITGRVVDEAGQPVAGAAAAVTQSVAANAKDDSGHPVWPHHQSVAVTADGTFSFKIETPGDYQVCAAATGTPPTAWVRVHLEGLAARPDVTLVLPAPVQLSGRVSSPDGQKHDFAVELQARDSSALLAMDVTRPKLSIPNRSRSTRATGDDSYRFDRLPAGVELEIRACPRTIGLQRMACTAPWIPVPPGATSFDFVAGDEGLHADQGTLLITVKSSTGEPVAGAHWFVLPEGQDYWAFNPSGPVPADGHVSVTALDPQARYTLVVTDEGLGTLDVHDLQPTVAGLPVEAVLPRPAQLDLVLVDAAGLPVASAPVTLKRAWQFRPGPVFTPPLSTDPHGELRVQDLAPGHYAISVEAHDGHLETTLDLTEGQLLQSRLVLASGGTGSPQKQE